MTIQKKPPLNTFVNDDEPLARYIFYKRHFSLENNRVKAQAFMPPHNKKISVIRHKGCPKDCLLKIGKGIEKSGNRNTLKAISSLSAQEVRSIKNLNVESDTSNKQHRRHANIIGFNNFSEAKIRQKAQDLAKKATLIAIPG